eukprot:GHVU01054588.1.p1 GENE.GHVU01054588.1~~GHVU01054588.1.p1  ORF type:complete len:771 (+),score=110.77 GHVU01054588.1:568-2880(+)
MQVPSCPEQHEPRGRKRKEAELNSPVEATMRFERVCAAAAPVEKVSVFEKVPPFLWSNVVTYLIPTEPSNGNSGNGDECSDGQPAPKPAARFSALCKALHPLRAASRGMLRAVSSDGNLFRMTRFVVDVCDLAKLLAFVRTGTAHRHSSWPSAGSGAKRVLARTSGRSSGSAIAPPPPSTLGARKESILELLQARHEGGTPPGSSHIISRSPARGAEGDASSVGEQTAEGDYSNLDIVLPEDRALRDPIGLLCCCRYLVMESAELGAPAKQALRGLSEVLESSTNRARRTGRGVLGLELRAGLVVSREEMRRCLHLVRGTLRSLEVWGVVVDTRHRCYRYYFKDNDDENGNGATAASRVSRRLRNATTATHLEAYRDPDREDEEDNGDRSDAQWESGVAVRIPHLTTLLVSVANRAGEYLLRGPNDHYTARAPPTTPTSGSSSNANHSYFHSSPFNFTSGRLDTVNSDSQRSGAGGRAEDEDRSGGDSSSDGTPMGPPRPHTFPGGSSSSRAGEDGSPRHGQTRALSLSELEELRGDATDWVDCIQSNSLSDLTLHFPEQTRLTGSALRVLGRHAGSLWSVKVLGCEEDIAAAVFSLNAASADTGALLLHTLSLGVCGDAGSALLGSTTTLPDSYYGTPWEPQRPADLQHYYYYGAAALSGDSSAHRRRRRSSSSALLLGPVGTPANVEEDRADDDKIGEVEVEEEEEGDEGEQHWFGCLEGFDGSCGYGYECGDEETSSATVSPPPRQPLSRYEYGQLPSWEGIIFARC